MTGDVSVNIPDTQDKRYTQFQVSLKDIRTTGLNLSQALTLTISVSSTNGIGKLTLVGNLSGTGGITVDSSIVSRIVLVNPASDTILVSGFGGVIRIQSNSKCTTLLDCRRRMFLLPSRCPYRWAEESISLQQMLLRTRAAM